MTTLWYLFLLISQRKHFSTWPKDRFVLLESGLNAFKELNLALDIEVSEDCWTALRILQTQLVDVLVCKSDRTKTVEKKTLMKLNKKLSGRPQIKMVVLWSCILELIPFAWGSSILSTPFSIRPILAVTEYVNFSRIKRMYYSWRHDKTITAEQKYFEYLRSLSLIVAIKYWCYVWEIK